MEYGPVTEGNGVAVLSIDQRKRLLPAIITRMVMGSESIHPWHGNQGVASVRDMSGETLLSASDFEIAKEIADQMDGEMGWKPVVSAYDVLDVRERVQSILEARTDARAGKKGIMMLKDKGGCGYWRMVLPARYMDRKGIYIDITDSGVKFESLMEYDTIFVQRLHDWDSFYLLERLKKVGKRIIYDIDDDLFSIPESNPAHKMIGRNEQMAVVECMKLADVVTTTTEVLQKRLAGVLDGVVPIVIPNAIEIEGWIPTPLTGNHDGLKRIFWQGSSTYEEDWKECFEAVEHIMKQRIDVRLVLMGFLPVCVRDKMNEAHFRGRIEHLESLDPEAYFRIIKHIRAEVGLAPLAYNNFNQAKSNIKWMENSMIGMPTVSSDVGVYNFDGGVEGFKCETTEEWIDAIQTCLDNSFSRVGMVENARKRIRGELDIRNIAKIWKSVLCGVANSNF